MEWFISSLPTDFAASDGLRITPALFQEGFASSRKWFHPAGFWALFAWFWWPSGKTTVSGYLQLPRPPAGYHSGSRGLPRRTGARRASWSAMSTAENSALHRPEIGLQGVVESPHHQRTDALAEAGRGEKDDSRRQRPHTGP